MIKEKYKKMYDEFKKNYKNYHINPWHEISEQELDDIYDYLISSMNIIDDYTFDYFINYIIKRLGGVLDAHTEFGMRNTDFLPIRFKFVQKELLVVSPKDFYGYRLISINDISIDKILAEFEEVITYGTDGWKLNKLERSLFIKRKLFSVPSLRGAKEAIFKLEDFDGNVIEKKYYKDENDEKIEEVNKNATYNIRNNNLIFNHSSVKVTEEDKLIKCIQKLEKEDLPHINKIIVDLRGNTGGNARLNRYLISFLEKNNDKELIALTDYRVYSGGSFALIDLINLGAVTIGEEIGTPINSYGSGKCSWSVGDYLFKVSGGFCLYNEDKTSLMCIKDREEFKNYVTDDMQIPIIFKPDINVGQTKEDFIANKDTVLEYAIDYDTTKRKENYGKIKRI